MTRAIGCQMRPVGSAGGHKPFDDVKERRMLRARYYRSVSALLRARDTQ